MSEAVKKEITEAALFIASVANAIGDAMKDGKVTIGDAMHLIPLLSELPSALDVPDGLNLSQLSLDELEWIKASFNEKFDLPNDKIEALCEGSLDIVVKLYALVKKFQD
jgi:hypothetical protein